MRKKSRIFARRSSGKTADGDLYVFFLNPDKSIDYDINNAGFSPMYHYYYYDATTLQDNMLRYLENHGMYERDMTDISDIDNDYEMEL